SLSRTEFDLLYALAAREGETVATEELMRSVWSSSSEPATSALDVTVHRLRKKLGRVPGGSDLIRTVRGKGYALAIPARSENAETGPLPAGTAHRMAREPNLEVAKHEGRDSGPAVGAGLSAGAGKA
ncbi:MAG: winged helix-turn-helix domain-containing protein, partial [Chloroflexi bacterium]|nr:winged helix-turn-helix domain-containing protein [Chloroflexota bacterium]